MGYYTKVISASSDGAERRVLTYDGLSVIIATLGIIYNLGADVSEGSEDLRTVLLNEKWTSGERVGQPVYTMPVVIGIMVFFALCMQCGATVAIIARELGIPAVVGCGDATERLAEGTLVTVSCAEGDTGYIYDGLLETEISEVHRGELPYCPIKIMMNVGNPQLAFNFAQMPSGGVGLARLEFIINNNKIGRAHV